MDKYELEAKLKSIVEELCKDEGAQLVELTVRRQNRDMYVQVLADKPAGGISVAECAHINHRLIIVMDEGNFCPEGYILEVSSPGLDRPLTTQKDFSRCLGKQVMVFLKEELAGKFEYTGTIESVGEDSVDITAAGAPVRIPLSVIIKAQQII